MRITLLPAGKMENKVDINYYLLYLGRKTVTTFWWLGRKILKNKSILDTLHGLQ